MNRFVANRVTNSLEQVNGRLPEVAGVRAESTTAPADDFFDLQVWGQVNATVK